MREQRDRLYVLQTEANWVGAEPAAYRVRQETPMPETTPVAACGAATGWLEMSNRSGVSGVQVVRDSRTSIENCVQGESKE